jgi:N-ethylmaleimide reductase
MTDLFKPVQIGAWQLNNRIVMAPLTRCRIQNDGIPAHYKPNTTPNAPALV